MFSKLKQKGTNPCAVRNGGCAELCLYNGTHPVCACAHGKVGSDGRSCEGILCFFVFLMQEVPSANIYVICSMNVSNRFLLLFCFQLQTGCIGVMVALKFSF